MNYYLSCRKEIFGPVDLKNLKEWLTSGRVMFNDWIWLPDAGDWYPVIEVPQLIPYFYTPADKPTLIPDTPPPTPQPKGTDIYISSEKIKAAGHEVEQRRSIRHEAYLSITYSKYSDFSGNAEKQKEFEGVAENIGKGGIGFYTKEDFNIGDFLKISVDVFPGKFNTLAEIRRIKESKKGLYIAAKFIKTSDAELEKLNAFIYSMP